MMAPIYNITAPPIALSGGGVWDQGGGGASHSKSLTFGGAITGNGGFTIRNANNKQRCVFSVANSFTGGLTIEAKDRHVVQFDAAGSAGAGNVTTVKRISDSRSSTLDIHANDVFAPSAILSVEGIGSE